MVKILGDYDMALEYFKKALDINKDFHSAREDILVILLNIIREANYIRKTYSHMTIKFWWTWKKSSRIRKIL